MKPLDTLKKWLALDQSHLIHLVSKKNPKVRWAFWGEEQKSPLPLEIQGNRVFILPTRLGLYWLIAIFVLLVGAMNYNNNMTFLISFMAFGATMVQMLETFMGIRGLTIKGYRAAPVFLGEAIPIQLAMAKRYTGSLSYRIGFLSCKDCVKEVVIQEGISDITLEIPSRVRGINQAGPLKVEFFGSMGLFRAWTCPNPGIECLVYPRPLPCNHRLLGAIENEIKASGGHLVGATLPSPASIRPYVPGDPVRLIHWKASLKGQGLVVKSLEYDDEAVDKGVLLSWYELGDMDTEERLSILTGCILFCENRQIPYSLKLPGKFIQVGLGPLHMRTTLRTLALFPARRTE